MIDNQTFMLALGVGNIAFALLMAAYMQGADGNPALRCWMAARMLGGLSQACWWASPYLGMPLVDALAAFAWIGSVVLEVAAYCQFFGYPNWRRVLYPAALAAGVALACAAVAGASRLQMTWVVSMIIALFASGGAVVLLRPRGAPFLQRLIGINNTLFALSIWAWLALEHGHIDGRGTPIGWLAYLFSYLMMIVDGFGFLLLCKQKDDVLMRRLATIDGLTGTCNRRAFFEQAESARLLALRLKKPLALLMLDIDHFKQLNDGFGHACGDQALKSFAETARGMLREHDLIGRLGGEEFALALPGTRLDGAIEVAERLRLAVSGAPMVGCAPNHVMTVSIGVVVIDGLEELTAALARADHALYAAKTGGRNRVEVGATMPAALRRA